jgi:hypothetical protein
VREEKGVISEEEEIEVHRPFRILALPEPSRKMEITYRLRRDTGNEVKEGLGPVGIVTVSKTLTLEGHRQ